jgi:hypothetical protein
MRRKADRGRLSLRREFTVESLVSLAAFAVVMGILFMVPDPGTAVSKG